MTLPTSNHGGQRPTVSAQSRDSRLDDLQAEMMAGMQGKDTAPRSVAPSLSVNNRPTLSLDGEFHGRIAYESEPAPVFAGSISYEELVEEQNSNQARIVDEAEAVADEHLAHAVRTRAPIVAREIARETEKVSTRSFWRMIVVCLVGAAVIFGAYTAFSSFTSKPIVIQQSATQDFQVGASHS